MSLYCKVECTLEELEVIRVELVTRGLKYRCGEYTEAKIQQDLTNNLVTHVALYEDGTAFGWTPNDDTLATIEFEDFMHRLDKGLPPRKAFRKRLAY